MDSLILITFSKPFVHMILSADNLRASVIFFFAFLYCSEGIEGATDPTSKSYLYLVILHLGGKCLLFQPVIFYYSLTTLVV